MCVQNSVVACRRRRSRKFQTGKSVQLTDDVTAYRGWRAGSRRSLPAVAPRCFYYAILIAVSGRLAVKDEQFLALTAGWLTAAWVLCLLTDRRPTLCRWLCPVAGCALQTLSRI